MKKAKRILVGLKTIGHTNDLTSLACRLGAPGASLMLVHVIELPDPTPLDVEVPDLDAMAKQILGRAKRIARRSKFKVKAVVLRAHSAATALLEEMKENRIDLAVLGYHHRRTIGEIILGTTAQHLAKSAPCHILFSIPPRKQSARLIPSMDSPALFFVRPTASNPDHSSRLPARVSNRNTLRTLLFSSLKIQVHSRKILVAFHTMHLRSFLMWKRRYISSIYYSSREMWT